MDNFHGMVSFHSYEYAKQAALNVICFIEKYRNYRFKEELKSNLEPYSFFDAVFCYDLNPFKWVFGKKVRTYKEALETTRDNFDKKMHEEEFNAAIDIICLSLNYNFTMFITPMQSRLIHMFGDFLREEINLGINIDLLSRKKYFG